MKRILTWLLITLFIFKLHAQRSHYYSDNRYIYFYYKLLTVYSYTDYFEIALTFRYYYIDLTLSHHKIGMYDLHRQCDSIDY